MNLMRYDTSKFFILYFDIIVSIPWEEKALWQGHFSKAKFSIKKILNLCKLNVINQNKLLSIKIVIYNLYRLTSCRGLPPVKIIFPFVLCKWTSIIIFAASISTWLYFYDMNLLKMGYCFPVYTLFSAPCKFCNGYIRYFL